MNGHLIVFEGLDFVGKTSLTQSIAANLGYIYYKTPPKNFPQTFPVVDERDPFSEERFDTFLQSIYFSSKEIQLLLKKGLNVIVDRWVWTTLAYHFSGNQKLWLSHKEEWQKIVSSIIQSELSFFCYIKNEKIWRARVKNGSKPSFIERKILQDSVFREKLIAMFLMLNPEFILFENSGTIQESTIKLTNKIKKANLHD